VGAEFGDCLGGGGVGGDVLEGGEVVFGLGEGFGFGF